MEIKTRFITRSITVILPSFLIIVGIFAIPYMNYKFLTTDSFLLKLGANLGGIVALIALIAITNPMFVAVARMKRGRFALDGSLIKWKAYFGANEIDLTQGHTAMISSGPGIRAPQSTSVNILTEKLNVNICLPVMERTEAVADFPEDSFIQPLSIPPKEGSGGYILESDNQDHKALFTALLKAAWQHRDTNFAHQAFLLFPWDKKPSPEVTCIQKITDASSIDKYRKEAFTTLADYMWVQPDYVLLLHKEEYFLLPVGHISAKVVSKSGVAGTTARIEFSDVLEFKGLDINGKEITLIVETLKGVSNIMSIDAYKQNFLLDYIRKATA
ncbi:hypothetical protein KKF84_06440 [Myxococcota bacterium]|nr:hypothetical protein [Myxococcota bacterium]MBU1534938.1 hypothetical protein [Myxococcota bacterium]